MATVIESLTIPRATATAAVTIPRATAFSSSSSSLSVKFSELNGLKLTSAALTRSVDSLLLTRRRIRRRDSVFRVSAESSDTTVQLPTLTEAEWKSLVLESELPVMVEFWAPWCGPCRMVQSMIDELAQQYAGKLKVYKVNTDESPSIASDYGIRSIPTVIIFKDGEKKDAVIGAVPKTTLTTSIEKFL